MGKIRATSNYNLFRGRTDDIAKVASNTGWDISDIEKIKNHMFLDDIKFSDGRIEKFVPDYEMSVTWQRLIDGQYYDNDILLLQHELTELSHMKQLGSFQEAAHDFANGTFNWAQYLKTLGGS